MYHGRVEFADWLAGLGLLVIVNHGEGYMTLYGYNETTLKNTGDWVAPGDVIATDRRQWWPGSARAVL